MIDKTGLTKEQSETIDEYSSEFYKLFCQLNEKEKLINLLQEEQNKIYKDVVEITEKIEKLREKESQFMKSITIKNGKN